MLTSPPTCASATPALVPVVTPYSDRARRPRTSRSPACPAAAPARPPSAPASSRRATPPRPKAPGGRYSPFHVHIGRTDGQQELKAVNVTLPKGLVGRLAGIPYCRGSRSPPRRRAAASPAGERQLLRRKRGRHRDHQCRAPAPTPLTLSGKVYLAGPYKGAPLSMAVITPAVSGPFDLGTVVVRVALNVNPETAQVNAVSDPIPNVFGGVKLDIRSIDVNMNRNKFMLNPTNCAAGATAGTINGGGGEPGQRRGLEQLRGLRRRSRRPAATSWGSSRRSTRGSPAADHAGQEPADPGVVEGQERRCQHRPHGAEPAALAVPRPGPHQDGLHEGPAGGPGMPEGLDLRLRRSEHAAARAEVEGSGLPGVLEAQAAGPPGGPTAARSTSSWTASSAPSTAG